MFNKEEIQQLFPQIPAMVKSNTTYLDSAATALKLKAVIDAVSEFDSTSVANVHRGSYKLSNDATSLYEDARTKASGYLNCEPSQVIFTHGTTDSLNILANSFENKLKSGDSILLSEMEHHANLLPWQRLSQKTGAKLLFCSVNENGELSTEEIKGLFKENNIKVFSICHVSNTLGTVNDIDTFSKICRDHDCKLAVDGAQAATLMKIDLKTLDVDYYTFSAHKIFGPFGVGVLYIKNIEETSLYQLGGGIIENVEFQTSTFLKGPQKMEPGTPNVSGIISMTPLFDFLNTLDFKKVCEHEKSLHNLAVAELSKIEGFVQVGSSDTRINILSFNIKGTHPNDLCELLDEQGLALRAGHHCTQPLLRKMNVNSCLRASFSIYNTEEDVHKLVAAVKKSLEVLR